MQNIIRVILSALLCFAVIPICRAQLCYSPTNCLGTPYLEDPEDTWISSEAWVPNRMPGAVIRMYNSNFCTNALNANYRGLAA
jgi:hypothetical protein